MKKGIKSMVVVASSNPKQCAFEISFYELLALGLRSAFCSGVAGVQRWKETKRVDLRRIWLFIPKCVDRRKTNGWTDRRTICRIDGQIEERVATNKLITLS